MDQSRLVQPTPRYLGHREKIDGVRCCMIRYVHGKSQFARSYTNVRIKRMTSSARGGTPRDWDWGRGSGEQAGKKEGALSLVVGAIVAVLRGGSPRLNAASPWEASRRPLSLYNFNSRLDDFVLLPFFSLFLALVALSVARKQLPATWLFQVHRRENVPAFSQRGPNPALSFSLSLSFSDESFVHRGSRNEFTKLQSSVDYL